LELDWARVVEGVVFEVEDFDPNKMLPCLYAQILPLTVYKEGATCLGQDFQPQLTVSIQRQNAFNS